MKIFKQYIEEETREEITKEVAVEYLENRGYFKPGTVESILSDGVALNIRSASAIYYFEN